MNNHDAITITLDSQDYASSDYTVSLDNLVNADEFTIDYENITLNIDSKVTLEKIEKVMKHYPGLERAYHNLMNTYNMIEQDYEGKIKSGEINDLDDDIPF